MTFQHYVPRVYLSGFTDPSTPSGQEPYVWVLDKEAGNVSRRAPKNVAGEQDYYESIGSTGGPGAGLEERLSRTESRFRAERDRIAEQAPNALRLDDGLMWFLATLSVRTPWARQAVEEHLQEHPPQSGALSQLSAHEQWAATVEFLAGWCAEYFRRMEWLLVGPKDPGLDFCTSDRPVVLTGSHMNGRILDVLRLTEQCSVATVAISSNLALVGSYQRNHFTRRGVTVSWLNDRVVESAVRFIYSSRDPRADGLAALGHA